MPIQKHNPSHNSPVFVPYPFHPFWQPNSWSASPSRRHQDITQLERLAQKLDTAEKKIDEYLKLIASLSVELNRYQDIICQPCKEKIFRTSLATASPFTPTGFNQSAPQSIFAASTTLSEPASATVWPSGQTPAAQPSLATGAPLGAHNQSSGISQRAGLHSSGPPSTADPIVTNPQATVASLPIKTTATISSYPVDTNLEPFPSISETATNAGSVAYNTEVKERLSLHVANTITFTAPVFCAKFSRDGKYLAVGLGNGEVHIHSMMTGSKIVLVERSATVFYTDSEAAEVPPAIWAVRFSRDNNYIATGGSEGQINIWEIERKRVCASFKHKEFVRSLDLSPDGRFLVSASYDDSVCVWCIRDGSRRRLWHGPSDYESVAFNPDGRFVVAGNGGGFLRIWDARTGQLVAKFSGHNDDVRSVVFAPDGKTIASGGDTLKCWDFWPLSSNRRSGRNIMEGNPTIQLNQLYEFKGHKSSITAVSFSSDNRWVVSSSLDHDMNILDARTGAWVFTLKAQMDDIWAADFSRAGHYLVSGGRDRPQAPEGRVVLYVVDFVK